MIVIKVKDIVEISELGKAMDSCSLKPLLISEDGFMYANGSEIPRSLYKNLYEAIDGTEK